MDGRRQLVAAGLRPRVAAGAALVALYLVGLGLVLGAGWLPVGLAVVTLVLAAATLGPRGLEAVRDPVARADAELGVRVAVGRAATHVTASGLAVWAWVAARVGVVAVAGRRFFPSGRDLAAAAAEIGQAARSRGAWGGAGAAVPALRRLAALLRRCETAVAVGVDAAVVITRRSLEQASRHLTAAATAGGKPDAIAPGGHDFFSQALELNRLGSVARREGRLEDAIEVHGWALKLVRELGDRRGEARTLGDLALALADEDPDAAVARCEEALAIVRELGERRAEGKVVASIAILHQRAGRRDDAIACWRSALDCFSPGSAEHARIAEHLRLARMTHSDGTGARRAAGPSVRPS